MKTAYNIYTASGTCLGSCTNKKRAIVRTKLAAACSVERMTCKDASGKAIAAYQYDSRSGHTKKIDLTA